MRRIPKHVKDLHPKLRIAWSSARGLVRGGDKNADADGAADRVVDLLKRGLADAGVQLDAQAEWHVHNALAHPLVQFLNESDLEQVAEALHTLTLPPDGDLAEPGAFATWLVGAIESTIAAQEAAPADEPESEDVADSKAGPLHRLAAAAAITAALAGGPKLDAGLSWRDDQIAFELDDASRKAVDRAVAIAESNTDKSDMAVLTRVADGLRSDGFSDYVTPEGYLRVKVRAARTGTQTYSDGFNTWGEYRDATEVFSAISLESWGLKPFTNDHPDEWVGIDNWAVYAKGTVGQDAQRDSNAGDGDEYVLVTIQISDLATLISIRDGKVELSAGYSCRVTRNPGRDSKGRAYEFWQHDILINHLSLVDRGRAGPKARISLDGFAWQVTASSNDTTDTDMATTNLIKVQLADGITVELSQADADALAAKRKAELDAAVEAQLAARKTGDAEASAAKTLDENTKAIDAMKADRAKVDAELLIAKTQAEDAQRRVIAVERKSLLDQLRGVCPKLPITDADGPVDIKAAAILDLRPDFKAALDQYPKPDPKSDSFASDSTARDRFVSTLFDAEFKAASTRMAAGPAAPSSTPAAVRIPGLDNLNKLRDESLGRVQATA